MAAETPLILVVDDQMGVRRLVQELFQEIGYRVAMASNGQEALALVAAQVPALVLLDMKMPIMDGLETLKALRARHPNLLVLMMTAVGDADRVTEALAHGAHGLVDKPFDIFELRKMVQRLIAGESEA